MSMEVRCGCGEVLRVPEPSGGEGWSCPSCGELIGGPEPGPNLQALEIPIQASAAERDLRMRDVRDVDEDEAAEDSGEDALEDGGFGSRIPKRVVWGVFLILLGLVGMLFIIKPKDPEFPNSVVQPVPQVRVAPADETSSVRVVLNTPATEAPEPGADLPMPLAEPSIPVKEPASPASSQGIGQAGERPAAPVQGGAVVHVEPKVQGLPSVPPAGPAGETKVQKPLDAGVQTAPEMPGSASKVVPSPTPQTQEAQKEAAKPAAEAERPGSLAAYKTHGEKFTLSVGSFKERKNAEGCKDDLEKKGLSPSIREVQIPGKGTWYRVSVGTFSSREEAQLLAKDVERKWQIKAFVAGLP